MFLHCMSEDDALVEVEHRRVAALGEQVERHVQGILLVEHRVLRSDDGLARQSLKREHEYRV